MQKNQLKKGEILISNPFSLARTYTLQRTEYFFCVYSDQTNKLAVVNLYAMRHPDIDPLFMANAVAEDFPAIVQKDAHARTHTHTHFRFLFLINNQAKSN